MDAWVLATYLGLDLSKLGRRGVLSTTRERIPRPPWRIDWIAFPFREHKVATRQAMPSGGSKPRHAETSVGADTAGWQFARDYLANLGGASEWRALGPNSLTTKPPTTGALVRVQHVVRVALMDRLVESTAMGALVRLLAAGSINMHAIVARSAVVVLAFRVVRRMVDAAAFGALYDAAALTLRPIVPLLGTFAFAVMLGATAALQLFGFLGRILRTTSIPLRLGGQASRSTMLTLMT